LLRPKKGEHPFIAYSLSFHMLLFVSVQCLAHFSCWACSGGLSSQNRTIYGTPPRGWSSPEWEVFKFLGTVGTDEPALRPFVIGIKGGSSGPPQRMDAKRRWQQSCAGGPRSGSPSHVPGALVVEGDGTLKGPVDVGGGLASNRFTHPMDL